MHFLDSETQCSYFSCFYVYLIIFDQTYLLTVAKMICLPHTVVCQRAVQQRERELHFQMMLPRFISGMNKRIRIHLWNNQESMLLLFFSFCCSVRGNTHKTIFFLSFIFTLKCIMLKVALARCSLHCFQNCGSANLVGVLLENSNSKKWFDI